MKKTSLWMMIGLCLVIGIALTACGKAEVEVSEDMTPTETVEAFLDSFKTQEWDNMDVLYAGSSKEFSGAYEDDGEESDELQQALLSKLYDFDYKVTGEEIAEDGKTATVSISTKTYDLVTVFNNFYQEYMDQALDKYTGKSGEMSDDDMEAMALEILQEQLDAATEKTYEGEADLTLTKEDGRWVVDKIDESNGAFLDAISGGMMSVASDVINTVEENANDDGDADDAKDADD